MRERKRGRDGRERRWGRGKEIEREKGEKRERKKRERERKGDRREESVRVCKFQEKLFFLEIDRCKKSINFFRYHVIK